MEQTAWVILNYTLPREPSRTRVSLWRKLKKNGAVNLQQSLWILPMNDAFQSLFHAFKEEIEQNDGEALVMLSTTSEGDSEVIRAKFKAARDEEYIELLEQCDDFLAEIEKETARRNFSFAEIEENEEDYNKLQEWFKKIIKRDFFGALKKAKAEAALLKCAEVLEEFCGKVYESQDKT
jgi:DNA-binding transcriptional regulator PaaX